MAVTAVKPHGTCGRLFELQKTLAEGGINRSYPPECALLNSFAMVEPAKGMFKEFTRPLRKIGDRVLLGRLSNADYRIWSAIYTRTVLWGKIAENITYEHFAYGLHEGSKKGPFRKDNDVPVFEGCGLVQPGSISKAITSLLQQGYISRLSLQRRHRKACFFAPFPLSLMPEWIILPAVATAAEQGELPMRQEMLDHFKRASEGWECVNELPPGHPFTLLARV